MTCDNYRDMMVEALYRELDAEREREFDVHVSGCAACAAAFEEMRATTARMSERTRSDPGHAYWSSYYDRLEARMAAEETVVDGARTAARRRSYVSWGYRVAAAVAVLAVGVWLGRSSMTPDGGRVRRTVISSSTQKTDSIVKPSGEPNLARSESAERESPDAIDNPSPGQPRQDGPAETHVALASADVRAREYIGRSQVLLLALVNSGADSTDAGTADFEVQRKRAGLLVSEAAVLRDDLPGGDNRRLRELVTDLQMILREIANLESQNDLDAVEIIRNRVDREGVLLKIDVEQMRDEPRKSTQTKRSGAID